jgi:hypothetical protein
MLPPMPSSFQAMVSTTGPETTSQDDESAAAAGSAPIALAADEAVHECARCAKTRRTCRSCVQRRRYAWSLVNEQGETVERAASIIELTPKRVDALIREESHRRELASLKCDSVPVELTKSAVEQALARDANQTIADMAHWLEMP